MYMDNEEDTIVMDQHPCSTGINHPSNCLTSKNDIVCDFPKQNWPNVYLNYIVLV